LFLLLRGLGMRGNRNIVGGHRATISRLGLSSRGRMTFPTLTSSTTNLRWSLMRCWWRILCFRLRTLPGIVILRLGGRRILGRRLIGGGFGGALTRVLGRVRAPDKKALPGGRRKYIHVGSGAVPYCAMGGVRPPFLVAPFCQAL